MVKASQGSSRTRKMPPESPGASPHSPTGEFITATIEAATGRIVDVRSVDDAGASSELTKDRRARLAKQSGEATLEDLFEQAFEAGIACVLGDDPEDDAEAGESEEEAAMRRQILQSMIEHSAARRLMQREALGRAIVGTLIRKADAGGPDPAAPSRPASAA